MNACIAAKHVIDKDNLNKAIAAWGRSLAILVNECKNIVTATSREYSSIVCRIIQTDECRDPSLNVTGYDPSVMYEQIMITMCIVKSSASNPVNTCLTNVVAAHEMLKSIVATINSLGRMMADWFKYTQCATKHIEQYQRFVSEFPIDTLNVSNMIQHLDMCLKDHNTVTDTLMIFLSNLAGC